MASYSEMLLRQQQTSVVFATSSNMQVAQELAAMQIRVFPCRADKRPVVKAWEQSASHVLERLELMWVGENYLPAIPVGAQGLVVIDCDRKPGGEDGVAAFERLCAELGLSLPVLFTVATPNGGRHYYFTTRSAYGNSASGLPKGIDVRGVGGYVIAPGATLPDGRAYRIMAGDWSTIPTLPDALAVLLRPKQVEVSPTSPGPVPAPAQPVSERNLAAGRVALLDESAKLRALTSEGGSRNSKLNDAAFALGTLVGNGSLQREAVEHALIQACTDNGYVAAHSLREAQNTIQSGLEAGIAKPRPLQESKDAPTAVRPVPRISLQSFSDIEEQAISWLWNGYLPHGKLTLLAGAGGTGKSTIAFSFAATITTGGSWPDGSKCQQPGNVVIWSSEDDAADTIKPRLMAMQADVNRCYNIAPYVDENGSRLPFDPARDIDKLREQVAALPGGIALFIIDPIVSAVTGDINKANEVRRSLQTIVDFAAEQNCAVLGITHFAKGTAGKNSAERVIGSQAFSAFARVTLVVQKEEESERRVLARAKSNISLDDGGYSYTVQMVQGTSKGKVLETTRIVWGEPLEGSSREILSEVEQLETDTADDSAISRAKQYLIQSLADGSMYAKQVEDAAKQVGISRATLRRAREALRIIVERDSTFKAKVRWKLPSDALAVAQMGIAAGAGVPWHERVQ